MMKWGKNKSLQYKDILDVQYCSWDIMNPSLYWKFPCSSVEWSFQYNLNSVISIFYFFLWGYNILRNKAPDVSSRLTEIFTKILFFS